MRLTVFLLALLPALCFGEERATRASTAGHLEYSDPSGATVNWKLFAPYAQWKTHLEQPQRAQRAEAGTAHPTAYRASEPQPAQQSEQPAQHAEPIQYKPYNALPAEIRHIIMSAYESQAPYVAPEAFMYTTKAVDASAQQEGHVQYEEAKEGGAVEYKEKSGEVPAETNDKVENQEYQQQDQTHYELLRVSASPEPQSQTHQEAQVEAEPAVHAPKVQPTHRLQVEPDYVAQAPPEEPKPKYSKHMPAEIKQLLHFQAQIPYNVIANHIVYRPKSLFIPKPLSHPEGKEYQYRTKIYFLKDEEKDAESEEAKPVKEESQQHS